MTQTALGTAQELRETFPAAFEPLGRMVQAACNIVVAGSSDARYQEFDDAFEATVRGIAQDVPSKSPLEYREYLLNLLAHYRETFPDWKIGYPFLMRFIYEDKTFAEDKITFALYPGNAN